MNEFELKYGCNPNQKPSRIYMADGTELPIEILSGRPGYINFLDAFNSWQLVKEVSEATGMVAATSFKHVSPTSAAVGIPLSEKLKKACITSTGRGLSQLVVLKVTCLPFPQSKRPCLTQFPWRTHSRKMNPRWCNSCIASVCMCACLHLCVRGQP